MQELLYTTPPVLRTTGPSGRPAQLEYHGGGLGGELGGIGLGGGLNTTTCPAEFGSVGSTKQSVCANASRDTFSAGGLASVTAPFTASHDMSAGRVLAATVKKRVTQPFVKPDP